MKMANIEVRAHNLSFSYKNKLILFVSNFVCHPQECICVCGINGVGKSVLLECLCGLLPHGGTVDFVQVAESNSHTINPRDIRIGAVLQRFNLWSHLRVSELLSLVESVIRKPIARDEFLCKIENRFFRHLSMGEKQYLKCAFMLDSDVDILFLDEPTMGLESRWNMSILDRVKNALCSRIIVVHDLLSVVPWCNRGYYLFSGLAIEMNVSVQHTGENIAACHLLRCNNEQNDVLCVAEQTMKMDLQNHNEFNVFLVEFLKKHFPFKSPDTYVLNVKVSSHVS